MRKSLVGPAMVMMVGWLIAGMVSPVSAQFGNIGGVSIDARGMLRDTRSLSEEERLKLIQQEAVGQPGAEGVASTSKMRKVSLKRLELLVQKHHQAGEELPADVAHLAGLTSVQYIIFDPASKDVILAGPAEGWVQLPTGEVIGNNSKRPVLHLEDLIEGLRFAFTEQKTSPMLGCSIDPTPEGSKRYAAYMNGLRMDRSRVKQIFAGMEQAMGPQAVRFFGVDTSTRFALVMLAADYRLKRIGLGHDPSPVKGVTNYLDLVAKRFRTGAQQQPHWWFEAQYDAIHETPDHLAFELIGQAVVVKTAPTIPGIVQPGTKQTANPQAEEFATAFTTHFPAIAQQKPIFAELQNLIGLATAAELIAEKQYQSGFEKHWKPSHFLNKSECKLREYAIPKQVPALANFRLIRNRHWLISISGGVKMSPHNLVNPENRTVKPHRSLMQVQEQLPDEPKSWWWD